MKRRTLIFTLIILLFGIHAVLGNADDYDWPKWRGPNGDGISLETDWDPEALAEGPKILWIVDVGLGYSNATIKDDRLYIMGIQAVYCLNAETGDEIWRYVFERPVEFQSAPTIDGKYVYALSKDGRLLCLKAKNGKVRWERNLVREFKTEKLPYGYAQSPVIEGNLLLLNINTSGIAVNKKTGEKVWASDIHTITQPEGYYATPVLYDYEGKRCALMFSGTGLFSVDVQTGNTMWFYEWSHREATNVADPIMFENGIFISSCWGIERGALLEISGNEPKLIWQNENMKNYFSTSVLVDGYLYGIDGTEREATLRCVDWETGYLMWKKEIKMASLISADGKLIMLEEDGTLRIAEATPSAYKEISSGDVLEGERKLRQFWTPPVLCNGKIYCRNFAGDLICIDVSE